MENTLNSAETVETDRQSMDSSSPSIYSSPTSTPTMSDHLIDQNHFDTNKGDVDKEPVSSNS